MKTSLTTTITVVAWVICALSAVAEVPIRVGEFAQQVHRSYSVENGLPAGAISRLAVSKDGHILALSETGGIYRYDKNRWQAVDERKSAAKFESRPRYPSLKPLVASEEDVRDVAKRGGEIAVAARGGLYLGDGTRWELVLPAQENVRWAPTDVRGVTYDTLGQLWFAAPQGVGCRLADGKWRLFTGADGLPYNDFTCIAAGPQGVWFGTTNGAILHHDGQWSYRQGRRWLLANHVRDIVVDAEGNAWIATSKGVSCIAYEPMTLAKKATYYSAEIEKYHRRTSFGYVNPATLTAPGDKSTARPTFSDNDGFNTGLYLAAVSFGYSVTHDAQLRQKAENAFRALAFLGEVTQGGDHPAPKGFVARNVVRTTEPDPNKEYDLEYDIGRNKRDALWKIIQPRLPKDKTGKWYWKCDTSSDELDGHFFGCAIYFDRACETEKQKDEVRRVVRDVIEHLLSHDFSYVDYDGKPSRWGHFSPDDLNRNDAWVAERGLNSYSILTYLAVAHHITGDPKYREVYLKLALEHGYGMNGMTQYKELEGPSSPGHQPDDNMAFMNYYHLIRYETDPKLLSMYHYAIHQHWKFEKLERNAFTNFIYGACCLGKKRRDQWGEADLSPPAECFVDAVETLKRYPLDLVEWPMSNAHRIDMVPLEGKDRQHATMGSRIDGYAFPIDERHETYWDWDPWRLTSNSDGLVLRPGFHYLLAYYLGRFHGFIGE